MWCETVIPIALGDGDGRSHCKVPYFCIFIQVYEEPALRQDAIQTTCILHLSKIYVLPTYLHSR